MDWEIVHEMGDWDDDYNGKCVLMGGLLDVWDDLPLQPTCSTSTQQKVPGAQGVRKQGKWAVDLIRSLHNSFGYY